MSKGRVVLAAIAAYILLTSSLFAAPFTAGNLVLYRVGDGAAAPGSGGTAALLHEYTPPGTLVQSAALPTGAGGLVASGTATTEGFLSRSEDGRYLVVPGYSAALGTTVTTSTTVPRVIGRVDGNANIDTSTSYVDASSAGNIRSATSVDGSRFWTSGSTQGPRTIAFGATSATVISTTNTNTRQINVFADQLYLSSCAGTVRLATIGSGTPTTAGQTTTQLPGFPTTTPAAFNSFFIVRLDGGPGLDTIYIADEGNNAIQKWCLVSGTWTLKGSVAVGTPRGLTASVSGTTVTLYATSGGTGTPGVNLPHPARLPRNPPGPRLDRLQRPPLGHGHDAHRERRHEQGLPRHRPRADRRHARHASRGADRPRGDGRQRPRRPDLDRKSV